MYLEGSKMVRAKEFLDLRVLREDDAPARGVRLIGV